jgi:hypothetical protein
MARNTRGPAHWHMLKAIELGCSGQHDREQRMTAANDSRERQGMKRFEI